MKIPRERGTSGDQRAAVKQPCASIVPLHPRNLFLLLVSPFFLSFSRKNVRKNKEIFFGKFPAFLMVRELNIIIRTRRKKLIFEASLNL